MVDQVEKLQQKLNASNNHDEDLNRIFADEKRVNTGHFNSKTQLEERQVDEIYKIGRRNSYVSVNMEQRGRSQGSHRNSQISRGRSNTSAKSQRINSEQPLQQVKLSFAQKFQKLYDNINALFPNFKQETGSNIFVDPSLSQKDRLSAPLVFNQLNFMYQ